MKKLVWLLFAVAAVTVSGCQSVYAENVRIFVSRPAFKYQSGAWVLDTAPEPFAYVGSGTQDIMVQFQKDGPEVPVFDACKTSGFIDGSGSTCPGFNDTSYMSSYTLYAKYMTIVNPAGQNGNLHGVNLTDNNTPVNGWRISKGAGAGMANQGVVYVQFQSGNGHYAEIPTGRVTVANCIQNDMNICFAINAADGSASAPGA